MFSSDNLFIFSWSRIAQVTFVKKPRLNDQILELLTLISDSYFIRKAFKSTVVNRALPSLYGGLLEIILIFSSKDLVNSKEILKVPINIMILGRDRTFSSLFAPKKFFTPSSIDLERLVYGLFLQGWIHYIQDTRPRPLVVLLDPLYLLKRSPL